VKEDGRRDRLGVAEGAASRNTTPGGAVVAAVAAVVACCGLLASCSHEGSKSSSVVGAGHVNHLLSGNAAITMTSSWQPSADRLPESGLAPRFVRDFENDAESDFAVVGDAGAAAPQVVAAAASRGARGLRFEAPGAVVWWLPVANDASYAVHAAVRRPSAAAPAAGETVDEAEERRLLGRVVVLELARPVAPRALESGTRAAVDAALGPPLVEHRSPPPRARGSFENERLVFTTSSRTASVALVLFGGVGAPADDGPVDFDAVEFFELPLARALAQASPPVDPAAPWRSFVREFTVAGETRRALVAVAPSEVRIPVELPRGRFRIRVGCALVDEPRESFGRTPVRFTTRLEHGARSDPFTIEKGELAPVLHGEDAGWHDGRLDGETSGEHATLVLATSVDGGGRCEDVALFSEPTLTTFDATERRRNVLLVSVDTLRRDRLDLPEVTPTLGALAKESVVFDEARALAPYTLPSHATLFTGLPPLVHGAQRFDSAVPTDLAPPFARTFTDAGYVTAAFTGGGFLMPVHGLHRGFDRWSTVDPFLPRSDPTFRLHPKVGDVTFNRVAAWQHDTKAIGRWLADHRDEPFLLFVHTYLVHNYRPPAEETTRFVKHGLPKGFNALRDSDERTPTQEELVELVERYDACAAAADRELGALLRSLHENGLDESTVVVVLSDHGEELGDHGGFGHGRTLYDEVLRVPLVVRAPGLAPRHVSAPVTLADVAPTLLSLAGLESGTLAAGGGRVLLPQPVGEEATFLASVDEVHLATQRALIVGRQKLLDVERMSPIRPALPVWSFFDLERDPQEHASLVAPTADAPSDPAAAQRFATLKRTLDETTKGELERRRALRIDPDATSVANPQLKQIGY
jgi:arylsulfatase A-like enzyme